MVAQSDIARSLERLQNAFEGRYGEFPIYEGERSVGMLALDPGGKKVYVTYRGSIDSFFEILSCLFIWKKDVPELRGKVHAGLYAAYQKTRRSFEDSLERILQQATVPREEIEFVVEGYSRGSGLAALTAFFLRRMFPTNAVNVLTYSTIRIFDQQAAESYNNYMGSHHWSFECEEDLVPKWIGPAYCGYRPIGKAVVFSAAKGPSYNERVRRETYTYLLQIPLISWLIKKVISAANWEAHMPQTYGESAPQAFSDYHNS